MILEPAFQYIDSFSESYKTQKKLFTLDRVLVDFQKKSRLSFTSRENHCLGLLFYIMLFIPRTSPLMLFFSYALREDANRDRVEEKLQNIMSYLIQEETFNRLDYLAFLFLCRIVRRIFPGIGGSFLDRAFIFMDNIDLLKNYQLDRKNRAISKYKEGKGKTAQFVGKGRYGDVFRRQGVIDKIYTPYPHNKIMDADELQDAIVWDRIISQSIDRTRQYLRSPLIEVDRTQNRISFRDEGNSLYELLVGKDIDDKTASELIKGWESIMYSLFLLHKARYAHRDIKMGNVVFNPRTGKLGLIDFDMILTFDELKDFIYQPVYSVWPLETYYYRARGLTGGSEQVLICRDKDGFLTRMRKVKYLKLWTLFNKDAREAFEKLLETIQAQGDDVDIDPSSFPHCSYSDMYFKVYASREARKLLCYDPSKVDTFSVGTLMMYIFYRHDSMINYLMKTFPEAILRNLYNIIFRMTHPLTRDRFNGEQAYNAWMEWIEEAFEEDDKPRTKRIKT